MVEPSAGRGGAAYSRGGTGLALTPLRAALLCLAAVAVAAQVAAVVSRRHPHYLDSSCVREGDAVLPARADPRRAGFALPLQPQLQPQPTVANPAGNQEDHAEQLLLVTVATASHAEFVDNWAAHAAALPGVRYLVGTYDTALLAHCRGAGVPVEYFAIDDLQADLEQRRVSFTRGGLAKLAGWRFVAAKLRGGSGVSVLYSDVDTAWLADPRPHLASLPSADMMASTDCTSHAWDSGGGGALPVALWGDALSAAKFPAGWPRCGHREGDTWGLALNAGVLLLRPTPPAMAFINAWLADMQRFQRPADGHDAEALHDMTDQESLVKLVARGMHPIREQPPGSRQVRAAGGAIAFATLPALTFANGHTFFIQRAPQALGTRPYVVHATFQLGGNAGKRNRMREHHLWLADPPAYYSDGLFIGYDDLLPPELLAESAGATQLARHMRLVSYYLHVTSHLLGLARAVGRTLILPRMLCLCDRDEHPDVLPACTTSGTDLRLPFVCPMDHVLDPNAWVGSGTPFRPHSFLESPSLPEEVRRSVVHLDLVDATARRRHQLWHAGFEPDGEGGFRRGSAHRTRRVTMQLRSMDATAVHEIRQRAGTARVVMLSGIEMGLPYCAEELDPEGGARLEGLRAELVWHTSWCCSDYDKDKGTHPFPRHSEYEALRPC